MENEVVQENLPRKRGPKPKIVEGAQPVIRSDISTLPLLKYVEVGGAGYNGFKPQTDGSAGIDLISQVAFRLVPGATEIIPTGVCVQIPKGYVGMVCSRSGLAAKNQVFVLNAPGIIDSDYTGEIKVILHNAGTNHFTATIGDRIAQLVIVPYRSFESQKVNSLDETERGSGGLGSTGK